MNDLSDPPTDTTGPPARSGSAFVLWTGAFLAVLLVALLVISPRLQDRMGLTGEAQALPAPEAVTEVPLSMDGQVVGVVVWDEDGVCAEVTDRTGAPFRTCAVPDPLRPIWAIDAPDEADPAFVILAHPPEVASVAGLTTDGESLNGLTQARELPAAWTVISLPEGAAVSELVAFNTGNSDLGNVECGTEDSPGDGPQRLDGGCVVPRQD